MAFLTRSVTCIVVNKSGCPLRLSKSELVHGSLDTPIPERIPAGSNGQWTSSTAGLFTGTEGSVVFEIEGAEATFEVYWDNPFIGDNSFKQVFRLEQDVMESPAGRYVPELPSGEDLQDADDVTVTYTLVMEPHPVAAASGGSSPGPDSAPPPPPPEDAPQVAQAKPGEDNHVSGIGVLTPPRLCVALNEVDPGDTGTDTSLRAILELIAKRLEGGLDVVWKKGAEKGLWDPTKWKETDVEEQWARAVTELLLGMPYNGAAAPYGHAGQDAQYFYKPFADPAAEPIVSFTSACQQNVTYGVLSRGYPLSDLLEMGFSCNDSRSMKLFKGGKWFDDADKKSIEKAIDAGLTPGSVYVFKPGDKNDPTQPKGSHIAFVLRVDADQKQAQFFDTFGLGHPGRMSQQVLLIPSYMGAYDDPLWGMVTTPHYIGMGIPKPPPDLAAAIQRIRKTRMIGFARLILVQRGATFRSPIDPKNPPPELLFVSRLLRMWGDKDDQNFTIARYYWSLRDLPATKDIQAYWAFWVPQDPPPDPKASPTKKVIKPASVVIAAPRTAKVDDFGSPLNRERYLIMGSLSNGKVQQVERRRTIIIKPANSQTKAISADDTEPKNAIPGHLSKLIDKLAPNAMICHGPPPPLPGLFTDYVPPAAVSTSGANS
jgi:hypothetical protein